ncbi:hypothetical protein [Streptomyces sp. NPDC054865]
MKHTYLYPLPENALFQWRSARGTATDLFGPPPTENPETWMMLIALDEQFGAARDAIARMTHEANRVRLGRRFAIPRSLDPHITDFEEGVHPTTRAVTHLLWDAPLLDPSLRTLVLDELGPPDAVVPRRDPKVEIVQFLQAHEGRRLVPIWM